MAADPHGPGDEDEVLPVLSEINVTPLVDVMLVLLIVFMVAAPLMVGGVPVNLPRTAAPRVAPQTPDPVVVTLDNAGRIFLREEELADGDLAGRLAPVAQAAPDTVVYLRADGAIPYRRVVEVMGNIAATGFGRVSLLAENARPPVAAPR